ncbi:MAG: extracellular solute-binding protein [Bacillales bacterium]|jgi:ABC-type glycerol-3-phosphate transport system substrate-binding protein|nr:extracellular solute-binding protein [Bacillales bacterium]
MKKLQLIVLSLLLLGCQNNSKKRDYIIFYVWGNTVEISAYEKMAKNYQELSGMEVRIQPATGNYYDNLNILFSSKTNSPDIFFTELGQFNEQIDGDKLLNLQPYIESKALDIKTDNNLDGSIELWDVNNSYKVNGDYYVIIKDWSPDFMLWYNKNHLQEYNQANPNLAIPDLTGRTLTWSEFADISYRVGEFKNQYGTMLDRVPYKHVMQWVQQTGDSIWEEDNINFNKNASGVFNSFKYFVELQKGTKASAPVIGPSGIGSGEAFANGNISFAFFGNWAYSSFDWGSVGFEMGLIPPPLPDNSPYSNYACSAAMVGLGINSASPVKEETVDFLNYYNKEGIKEMAFKGFNLPGNKKIASQDEYLYPEDSKLGEINRIVVEAAENYCYEIKYNKLIPQTTIEEIFGKYFSSYLANYINTDQALQNVLNNIYNDIKNEL